MVLAWAQLVGMVVCPSGPLNVGACDLNFLKAGCEVTAQTVSSSATLVVCYVLQADYTPALCVLLYMHKMRVLSG